MGFVVLYIALCIIVGVAANTRGRDAAGWAFLSLILSPLIAGLLVLALPNQHNVFGVDEKELRRNIEKPSGRRRLF
jgi:hypothetical protein